MEKKVSVILPSLNVADYIEECLTSVVRQTLKEIEIICVDAGSDDGTREILERYAESDDRITVIDSEVKSYGYQVNRGIECAKGKYIAILETDDFVAEDMYGKLYETAEEYGVDYAGANYDSFTEDKNGVRRYITERENEKYGHLYEKNEIDKLIAADGALWKGIYLKEFLTEHKIYFHETAGAAFQDISFLQLVKWSAGRIIYIEDSLYRYRADRPAASTKQIQALRNVYQEFEWLEQKECLLNPVQRTAYYRVMICLFRLWGDYVLRRTDYDVHNDFFTKYMEWFRGRIKEAFAKDYLRLQDLSGQERDRTEAILESLDNYVSVIRQYDVEKERFNEELLGGIARRKVVLFGTGVLGRSAVRFLLEKEVEIAAVSDNNPNTWDGLFAGIKVQPPAKISVYAESAVYLIAVKNHFDEIKQQLTELGIQDGNIRRYVKFD